MSLRSRWNGHSEAALFFKAGLFLIVTSLLLASPFISPTDLLIVFGVLSASLSGVQWFRSRDSATSSAGWAMLAGLVGILLLVTAEIVSSGALQAVVLVSAVCLCGVSFGMTVVDLYHKQIGAPPEH